MKIVGSGLKNPRSVAVDPSGNIYLTGQTGLEVVIGDVVSTFDGQTVHGQGLIDVFVLKYSSTGTLTKLILACRN